MRLRSLLLTALLLAVAGCTTSTPAPAPEAPAHLAAGFRYSVYGPDYNPGPAYWAEVGRKMSAKFPGSVPGTVWIVGRLKGQGSELSFPGTSSNPLIQFTAEDTNEEALTLFDRAGYDCWLQIEPGNAPVVELIDLMLQRYKHHPCVVGVGVDVEWYRSVEKPDGDAVSDADATEWLATARRHNPRYRLFLKHWLTEKMPPTVRAGILFIDDSQIFPSADAMVEEFAIWGKTFAPAPVGFQIGYDTDRPWWQKFADPPKELGERIQAVVPNLEGIYWVDFSVIEVFPPPPEIAAAHAALRPEMVKDPVVGVKIYERPADLEAMFAGWAELGVTTAFVSESLAADQEFRRRAAEKGVSVFLIFPVFFNPAAIAAQPDLIAITSKGTPAKDDWVEFVCPSRQSYREARVRQARDMIEKLRPQGLSLDFIRHFVFWEKVKPATAHGDIANACFCEHCLASFSEKSGIRIPDGIDTPTIATWIFENHAAAWTEWRVGLVDTMAADLAAAARQIDPNIRINIHAVPWRRTDFGGAILRNAGQNIETLSKHADFVSPMCYAHMQERPPDWVHSVVARLAEHSAAPILPSIQVREAYRPGVPFTEAEFEQNLREALKVPSRGVVFWSWEALAAEPAKLRVASAVLNEVRKQH